MTEEEVPELLRFLNTVFRPNVSAPLELSFPLFFGAPRAKLDDYRVLQLNGKIVSHVGICHQRAVLGVAKLDLAWIGAVATDPAHRSRGFAGVLMNDALTLLRDRECDLALLNGPRRLYERFGFDLGGPELRVTLSASCLHSLADTDAHTWKYGGTAEDVARITVTHDAEIARIDRTEPETEALLHVPRRSTYCASTGPDFAYVVVDDSQKQHDPAPVGVVLDFGGELGLVARLVESLFADREFGTLLMKTSVADDRCQLFAQVADGYSLGPFANLRVVSLRGLFDKVGPVLSQRYASLEHPRVSRLAIEWHEDHQLRERVCLDLESGTVRDGQQADVSLSLNSLGLVQLLFGPRLLRTTPGGTGASEVIRALFPLEIYAAALDRN